MLEKLKDDGEQFLISSFSFSLSVFKKMEVNGSSILFELFENVFLPYAFQKRFCGN
jgi:hypothetical protein